jgi:uncharacterized protein (DUF3084 family)
LEESKKLGNDSSDDSDLNHRVGLNYNSEHAKKKDRSNISLEKLANDVSEIKALIEDTGISRTKLKDFLVDVNTFKKKSTNDKQLSFEDDNLYLLREQLRKEKISLKQRHKFIEREKKRWRQDKQDFDEGHFALTAEKKREHEEFRQNLERQIDNLNERISDYKRKEKLLRKREQEEEEENDESMFDRDVSQLHLY